MDLRTKKNAYDLMVILAPWLFAALLTHSCMGQADTKLIELEEILNTSAIADAKILNLERSATFSAVITAEYALTSHSRKFIAEHYCNHFKNQSTWNVNNVNRYDRDVGCDHVEQLQKKRRHYIFYFCDASADGKLVSLAFTDSITYIVSIYWHISHDYDNHCN